MSTRKRKQDPEELQALPSDESEEEEEYVSLARCLFGSGVQARCVFARELVARQLRPAIACEVVFDSQNVR